MVLIEKELAVLEAYLKKKKKKHWGLSEGVRGEHEREEDDGNKTAV